MLERGGGGERARVDSGGEDWYGAKFIVVVVVAVVVDVAAVVVVRGKGRWQCRESLLVGYYCICSIIFCNLWTRGQWLRSCMGCDTGRVVGIDRERLG